MKRSIRKAALVGAAMALSLDASAQAFLELDTGPTILGAGVATVPDYRGSDDNTGAIAPFFRHSFSGTNRFIQLNATELSLNVVNNSMFRFGPVLNYHPGRDDDVDDAAVRLMRPIDDTFELGVFGEVAWIDGANPRNRFVIGVTLLTDVGGESDGFRARLNARYWRQVTQAIDLHIGGGIWYADSSYNDHYFGVNAANRGSSGLPFYSAGSGVNEAFVTLGALAYLSRNWVGMAGVRLSQITGDAKDSPVVSLRGDKSQFVGGVGLGYMWR